MRFPLSFYTIGCLFSVIGALVGIVIGALIGGNIEVPFMYGNLPGYEGAGLLGAMAGSALAALAWLLVKTPRIRAQQRPAIINWAIASLIALMAQHLLTLSFSAGFFPIIFLPALSPLVMHRQ